MPAALAVMKRAWPYLVAVAVVLGALYGAYRHGVGTTTERYERKLADERAANSEALARAHANARGKELAAAQEQAAIEAELIKGQADAQAKTDRTIADLRAGNIRLRNELASANCAITGVSDLAAGTGQRDAACAGGLRPEHAAFFVRFADRADAVARQLQAAQAVIEADRKVCGVAQ